MFLFPWLDWGDDISDFEKIDFLADGRFWGVPSPWEGWFLALATLASVGRKFSKSVVWKKFFEKFLEKLLSFPKIYFGHAGTTPLFFFFQIAIFLRTGPFALFHSKPNPTFLFLYRRHIRQINEHHIWFVSNFQLGIFQFQPKSTQFRLKVQLKFHMQKF